MPQRIHRRNHRAKLPPNTKLVSRASRWGNPFRVAEPSAPRSDRTMVQIGSNTGGKVESRAAAVELYRWWLAHTVEGRAVARDARVQLRGYNLACYCPIGEPCHADVLLEIANA